MRAPSLSNSPKGPDALGGSHSHQYHHLRHAHVAPAPRKPLELKSVLYIGFDNVEGAVLAYQHPEPFISPDTFRHLRPILVPKEELLQRVLFFYDAESNYLLLYCCEQLRASHYERNMFTFSVCFAFEADRKMPRISENVFNAVTKRYSAALLKVVGQLRLVEVKYRYLLHDRRTWSGKAAPPQAASGAAPAPASTPSADRETTGAAALATALPVTIPCTNAFDAIVAVQESWSALPDVMGMVFECLSGAGRHEVVVSMSNRFHLQPMLQRMTAPPVRAHNVPHIVRRLHSHDAVIADILAVDVYEAVDGVRTVHQLAEALGIPLRLAIEATQHLAAAGYIKLLHPVTLSSVYRAAASFEAMLKAGLSSEAQRQGLVEYILEFAVSLHDSPSVDAAGRGMRDTSTGTAADEASQQRDQGLASDGGGGGNSDAVPFVAADTMEYEDSDSDAKSVSPLDEPALHRPPSSSTTVTAGALAAAAEWTHEHLCSAAVFAIALFCGRSGRDVQALLRQSSWAPCFGHWSDAALMALIEYCLLQGWLEQCAEYAVPLGSVAGNALATSGPFGAAVPLAEYCAARGIGRGSVAAGVAGGDDAIGILYFE